MTKLYLLVFKLCGLGCRQLPDHSFSWKGYQFLLCSRCLGVLVGAGLVLIYFLARKRLLIPRLAPSCFLCLPLVIHGALQVSGITPWANATRFSTGILFACGAVNLSLLSIAQLERGSMKGLGIGLAVAATQPVYRTGLIALKANSPAVTVKSARKSCFSASGSGRGSSGRCSKKEQVPTIESSIGTRYSSITSASGTGQSPATTS